MIADLAAPVVHHGRVLRWTLVPSPVDDLLAVSDGDALTALWFSPHSGGWPAHPDAERDDDLPLFAEVRGSSPATSPGTARVRPAAGAFRQRVPAAGVGRPARHPLGSDAVLREIAAQLGLGPEASRAVGTANGANPIPVSSPATG